MRTRRELLQVIAATGALLASAGKSRSQTASGNLTQDDLLQFRAKGQVTLLHMTDCHAQLLPIYFREPTMNIGVEVSSGSAPHITDRRITMPASIAPGSYRAYSLSGANHEILARAWGKVGGMDRMATLVNAIRVERGAEKVLLLDGGDTLQGSFTALRSKGADMASVIEKLGVEATTGHWEFTLGADRIVELFGNRERSGSCKVPFLAGNIVENDFEEPVFHAMRNFEKGGVKIAVIGQAFPYTPIANPSWMFPKWSMGIREEEVRKNAAAARAGGAEIVVLLSHNGLEVDRKLAARVEGIDVILAAHTHDALPEPIRVGSTLIIASGSHTKFLSRLDLEVSNGRVVDYAYALIPVLADAIAPDKEMTRLVDAIRSPHEAMLRTELATTTTELYRRDTFAGTMDELILAAILKERDAEIAFSPGFRWGATVLPGKITWEDVYNATAVTYPACYRMKMTGERIKAILEDVADNLFAPDPYYQQGGDMVRVGGLEYRIDVEQSMGQRIRSLSLMPSGQAIQASQEYVVAGWGSVNEGTEGPPIWDVVANHLQRRRTVAVAPSPAPLIFGSDRTRNAGAQPKQ